MKNTRTVTKEEWALQDPYSVPSTDFNIILEAAEAWKCEAEWTESNPPDNAIHVEHVNKVSKGCQFLLTPLLRIPYWKSRGLPLDDNVSGLELLKRQRTYSDENTNRDVGFLPTCAGKDPQGNRMDVLDPSFNPFCVLANHWRTPSVTIPFSVHAPHPIRNKRSVTMPFALLLTVMPAHHAKRKAQGKCSLTELLLVAHRLSIALSDYHPPPPYIKELWELSGQPAEEARATWPTDFTKFGD